MDDIKLFSSPYLQLLFKTSVKNGRIEKNVASDHKKKTKIDTSGYIWPGNESFLYQLLILFIIPKWTPGQKV